jgi:HSP20 family protein
MPIRRWDPLRDLLTLQERMNRLFEHSLVRGHLADPALASGGWTPLADVYETAEGFVVQIEVPGIAEEDIEVQVDGDTVVVRGQRQPVSRSRPDSFHRMERSYGSFSRSFQLSEEVDPERVTARFKDGLLRVELPKLHARGGWRLREKG